MLMKQHRKKAFIFLMICCLLFSMVPIPAFAEKGADTDEAAVSASEETGESADAEQQTEEQEDEAADTAEDSGPGVQDPAEPGEAAKDPEQEPAADPEEKGDGAIRKSADRASGTGFVKLVKSSQAPADISLLSGYTLANARYQVYTNTACTDAYKAVTADGRNAAFVTDAGGASTETLEMRTGDYWLKETVSPNGHAVNPTPVPFSVSEENTAEASPAGDHLSTGDTISFKGWREGSGGGETALFSATVDETAYTGTCAQSGVALSKTGTANVTRIGNDTKIAKAIYHFAYELGDENWWTSSHRLDNAGNILGISGTQFTKRKLLECFCQMHNMGVDRWYTVNTNAGVSTTTAKAVKNYYNNLDVSGVTVPDNFEIWLSRPADSSQQFIMWRLDIVSAGPLVLNVSDSPVYGKPDFRVYKTDTAGTLTWDKIGRATFTIKYYDVANKSDIAGAEPVRSWSFETSKKEGPGSAPAGTYWSGFDFTDDAKSGSSPFYTDGSGDRVLPVGWFTIEETVPPAGFSLISDKYYGHVSQDAGGNAVTVIEGAAEDGSLNKKVVVFRDEHYKTTVHKVNASGAEMAGAQLQILQGNTVIKQTWTTAAAAAEFDDLAPGTYTLREVKAPYGFDLADDVSFTAASDKSTTVTMKNTPVTLGTTAVSAATGKHTGARKTNEKISDTVRMTGLVRGRKYKLTGQLMNKRTGSAIVGAAANKEFTATAESMDVTMDITFDSTALADGDSVVVYETLYRTSKVHGETVPVELQKHQNVNDAAQTVTYPGISTTATDQASGTKNMLAAANAVIKDTVSYKGLTAGETYTLEGELFDKTRNRLTGIKSTASLTPSSSDGTAVITFTLDARSLENHTLVVYETLKTGTVTLAEHKNPDDASQTIYIPEVKTTLTDRATGDHVGGAGETVTFNDTVVCSNLIVGRTYTINGKLVYKDSGNDVLDNGNAVTASKSFTAAQTTETQTLTFTLNGNLLEGKTVAAFEDLLTERKKVGTHADLNDEEQSVHFPKIRTEAAISDDKRIITDTISYENLLPGKKYVFRGWLVDTAAGTKIRGSDGRVELNAGVNTSGSVTMQMDTSGYDSITGHSMTAFEELYVIETVDGAEKEVRVAEHKDRSGDASANPQIIEIYQDLKVMKNVTGNLGDLSKVFEYTAEFTGLAPGQPYKIEGDDEKTFMADSSGKAAAGIKLKDGQTAVIRDLPKGATYKVTEAASDHIAEYRIFSEDMADKGAKIIKAEDSNGADAGKILATAVETVDLFDGTVVILWENNRDLATLTGVQTYIGIWAAALALVLAGLSGLIIKNTLTDRKGRQYEQ